MIKKREITFKYIAIAIHKIVQKLCGKIYKD